MARLIRVFLMNAGDCGACAAEVWAAVEGSPLLAWATTPQAADVIALTGSVPASDRTAFLHIYTMLDHDRQPLVAIGRCALDGYPYGKGGVLALPDITTRRKVDGCPPITETVVDALLEAGHQPRLVDG